METSFVDEEIAKLKQVRERVLGPYGIFAERISKTWYPPKTD